MYVCVSKTYGILTSTQIELFKNSLTFQTLSRCLNEQDNGNEKRGCFVNVKRDSYGFVCRSDELIDCE